jgi:hypothetical protein
MARYTDKLVATLQDRYENTDQSMLSIAAEFDIGARNLQRLVTKYGWAKRSKRTRDVPRAQRLLEEAQALAAMSPDQRPTRHPEERAQRASKGVGPNDFEITGPHPSRLGATRLAPQDDGDGLKDAETAPSAIDRLERLVLKEIEAQETVRKSFRGKRRVATTSERNARTLATLTQTLHALQRLRAGIPPEHESFKDDDDMPHDIDEFRRALARRIETFVASRTDAGDDRGGAETALVDEVR